MESQRVISMSYEGDGGPVHIREEGVPFIGVFEDRLASTQDKKAFTVRGSASRDEMVAMAVALNVLLAQKGLSNVVQHRTNKALADTFGPGGTDAEPAFPGEAV